jgi:hypothetical protein
VVPGLPNITLTPSCLSRSRKARFPDITGKFLSPGHSGSRAFARETGIHNHDIRSLAMIRLCTHDELGSLLPDLQRAVVGNVREVIVGCEHRQLVTDAQFGQKGVDRSDLYPGTSAPVS